MINLPIFNKYIFFSGIKAYFIKREKKNNKLFNLMVFGKAAVAWNQTLWA